MNTFRVHYQDLNKKHSSDSVLAIADNAQGARSDALAHLNERFPTGRWKINKVKFVTSEKV